MPAAPDFPFGLAQREQIVGMTGREILQAIVDGRLPQAPISKALKFWIVEVGDGFAAFEGEADATLLNPMGTVHGGWALTLIDSVASCAGHSLLPAGVGYATIETKGTFSRPITKETGRVRAEARVLGRGRQIISSEAKVFDASGRILAHGSSTIMVLGEAKA
jgi:uncharacterized protein (TIGR00369 family)